MGALRRLATFTDQGVSSLSNFAAVAIAANVAGTGEFGQFSLAYAGLLLFLGAQRAFVGETLLVRYSRTGALTARIVAASLGGSVLCGVPAALFLLGGGALAGGQDALLWQLMALAAPFILLQDSLRYLFICQGLPGRALAVDGLWAGVSIPAMLLAASNGWSLVPVLSWWIAGALAAMVLGLIIARSLPAVPAGARWLWLNRDCAVRYLAEFAALNASSFAVLYLLVFPLGAAGVGALRAAQLLFSPLNTVFGALKTAIIPELVRARGTAMFRRRLLEAVAVVGVLSVGWGAAVLFLPAAAGEFVLGETWANATELRWPYTVQYLAMVPYTIMLACFRATEANRLSTSMRGILAGATLILPLGLALYGSTVAAAWGFAAATGLAAACGLVRVAIQRRGRVPASARHQMSAR